MINDIMPIIYHRTRSNTSSRFRRKVTNTCKAETVLAITETVSKDQMVNEFFAITGQQDLIKTQSRMELRRILSNNVDEKVRN